MRLGLAHAQVAPSPLNCLIPLRWGRPPHNPNCVRKLLRAGVPKDYYIFVLIYPSKGNALLPLEQVARRSFERGKKKQKGKVKERGKLPWRMILNWLLMAGGKVLRQNKQLELWRQGKQTFLGSPNNWVFCKPRKNNPRCQKVRENA